MKDKKQVFQIPGKKWWVLVTSNGKWGMCRDDRFLAFTSIESVMPLLPLLELSYVDVEELICGGLKRHKIDIRVMDSFPYEYLLCCALTWPTDYWTSLALSWLEEGCPTTKEILACLEVALEKDSLSQKNKHLARKIMRAQRPTE